MPDSENSLPKHHSDAGFRPLSKTFHSLRPPVPLPPATAPLSITQYCLSLLRSSSSSSSSSSSTPTIINATKSQSLTYSQFITQTRSLASSLKNSYSLSQNDVAFIVSPASIHVPVLYFALISLGVVVSPANPISSRSEIANMVELSKPVIAFATSEHSQKLPSLKYGTILIDSPEFDSFLTQTESDSNVLDRVKVNQSDPAAILYSSGTTGRVKGVILSHRNIIAQIAGMCLQQSSDDDDPPTDNRQVLFFTVPLFHTFGFTMFLWSVAMAHTMVLIERSDFEGMLKAIERFKITFFPVSPPLVVAFVKSDFTDKYELSSLQTIVCGGAPLGKDVARRFIEKFPNVGIQQGYGLTETGGVSRPIGREESKRHGSVGRIAENMEAKIVDPVGGEALPPNHRGELWLRGPTIMKGYVGDGKATSETFDSEGWLKTGDICYFDSDGFLYIVDRLKELIKYKGYQVPPAELEQLLHSHSEIADAAVIPSRYPDEEAGQIPMAFIVRKPESNITEARIMDYIAKQVAPYKKIRRVAFIASIPKSPAGKILRRELVNHAVSSASKL